MEQYDKNIADIEKLEDEIRKLSIPYVSEEPGPLYWANFRVRVMDQIAQKEEQTSWFARVQQFLAGHIWGSTPRRAISAAALLVVGIMIFRLAAMDTPADPGVSSAPMSALNVKPVPMASVQGSVQGSVQASAAVTATEIAVKPELAAVQERSQPRVSRQAHSGDVILHSAESSQADLAAVTEPVSEPAENSVSLDDLSQPQLEAIVQDLEGNE